ncbi:MAG: hypothetical protein RQ899_01925 [Pseudomonadales bacterium]|nr:hypothetical protein [Pseudomonadales bacterium]
MVRVILPYQLQRLAHVDQEVQLELAESPPTQRSLIAALEAGYPMLSGAIVDHDTGRRRPLLRFFACGEDLSQQAPDSPLPASVISGQEPFLIVGAIAGG